MIPIDWAPRVADGRMLWDANCTAPTSVGSRWGRRAAVANGYLGTHIDSGTLFIAGAFTGLGPNAGTNATGNASAPEVQRSHLARVPSALAVRVTAGRVEGCALDIERATFLRRTRLPTAVVTQSWYAHRSLKGLLVMELVVDAAMPTEVPLTVEQRDGSSRSRREVNGPPSADVDWHFGCNSTQLWCRAGSTRVPDLPSTPPTRIAYVSTPIPPSLRAGAGKSSALFIGAARSSHVTADPEGAAHALHASAVATGMVALRTMHQEAWLAAWGEVRLEIDGDDFIRRSVNATLYYLLSGHDDTCSTGYPVGMEGLVEGAFGHWGGAVLWDSDSWIYPSIAPWRPDFQACLLEYRRARLPQARIISHQPSAISHQPSVISHQSSAVRYQLSVISCPSSVTSHQPSVISHHA